MKLAAERLPSPATPSPAEGVDATNASIDLTTHCNAPPVLAQSASLPHARRLLGAA